MIGPQPVATTFRFSIAMDRPAAQVRQVSETGPLGCPIILLLEGPTGVRALPQSPILEGPSGTLSPGPSPDPGAHIQTWRGLPPLLDLFQLEIQSVPGGLVCGLCSLRVGKSQNQHKLALPKRP